MTARRRRQRRSSIVSLLTVTSHLVLFLSLATALLLSHSADAFQLQPSLKHRPRSTTTSTTTLFYEPKWKKKKTLAEEVGTSADGSSRSPQDVGIKGNVKVVFQQGNETKTTVAFVGQPIRDVATQAGQFIKYGCGKGECGTCECLVNGQWIRPCQALVPADAANQDYVVQVKQVKAKAKSSGKFYSFRSFIMGFYNNLLGMVGFVKYRRAAKKNWQERQEYEDLIKQRTLEKKRLREQQAAQAGQQQQTSSTGGGGSSSLKP